MVVRTTRTGQVNLGSVNIKKSNPDKNGWILKSQKDIPNIEANLNDEVKAIAQYEEHKKQTDDPGTAAVLDHIQEEEEMHKEELAEAKENNEKYGETLDVSKCFYIDKSIDNKVRIKGYPNHSFPDAKSAKLWLEKAQKPRIGKPYEQQLGRKPGKGAGKIVQHPGRDDEQEMIPQDLDEEMKQAVERDVDRPATPFAETGGVVDTSKISDVDLEGIDLHDAPDFVDTFIASATYMGRPMTEEELDIVNTDHSDFVFEQIPPDIMARDDVDYAEVGLEVGRTKPTSLHPSLKSIEKGKPYAQQMGRKHGKGAGYITPAEKLKEAQAKDAFTPPDEEAAEMQKLIDNGQAWHFEGSVGRAAMAMIESGRCILGEKGVKDYYGNYVPSRYEVQPGTKGSLEYAQKMQEEFE